MKKTMHIATAAVLAVLAWGCTGTVGLDEPEGQEITVTATFAENRTKTTLQEGGTEVYWESGDEIKVFYETNGSRFTSTLTSSAATSDFSGSLNFVFGVNEGVGGSKNLWAVYPYRSDATSDGSSITTTLPSEQTGRAGSFAKSTNISLAKSNTFNMGFYNVCGGVRFSVTRADVTDVVFEALGGESVAGRVKLGFSENIPVVKEVIEGEEAVTLTAPGGGVFETGKWYYIVALPGTLSEGFKITFNTATKYAVLKSTDARTVKRGKFGSLADADDGLIYRDKGTPEPGEDNIVFKDNIAKSACVAKFDIDGDGEVSIAEAEAATSFDGLFTNWKSVAYFDEISYFKNVHSLSGAFNGCDKLVSITIPENITNLGSFAFKGCSSLTSVSLPSGITAIGKYTFQNCTKLASIDIPLNVSSIGSYAFSGCTALKTVTLPSKVTYIGMAAFYDCSALEQIVIPDGVTSLGSYAFLNCTALKAANIPSGISSIPASCFSGCSSLTSVTVPSGITSVGESAFSGVKMWKLELPSTITSLGSQSMGSISCVIVPSTSPVSIESDTFSGVYAVYVPANLMEMYKAMTHWSDCSSKLHPLTSYREKSEFVLGISGAVDMGLSVKWAAYNVGATKPEEYGDYYAWGETETKLNYGWSTYKYCNGSNTTLTKYCVESKYGTVDNKTVLDSDDDVAHVKWGGSWRMPTDTEMTELRESCLWEWTTFEGINGRMVYSFNTGNKIFMPAAGYRFDSSLLNVGSSGGSWSSSLNTGGSYRAWRVFFNSDLVSRSNYGRCSGLSVRPVSE